MTMPQMYATQRTDTIIRQCRQIDSELLELATFKHPEHVEAADKVIQQLNAVATWLASDQKIPLSKWRTF